MDSTVSLNGIQTRKKRVLPTRSRRGGPGVGSCDIDLMILETHKRRSENEPLIPSDTPFLLTTDSSVGEDSSSDAEVGVNIQANERYFDRPEVLKAFREQLLIETPHFVHVADLPSVGVGGRFRPRGSGENLVDTSDAAYEKRHRKYETFEKRLRLREKEKLKHEHYKLKERIEQLKSMDGSAFLSLPASSFPPVDGQDVDNSDDGTSSGHDGYSHHEGERRRKEMLDVALALEERYRLLLPPRRTNTGSWAEQDSRQSEEKEEPFKPDGGSPGPRDSSGIKLKIKLPNSQSQITTAVQQAAPKKSKQIALPPKPSQLRRATSSQEVQETSPPPPSRQEPSTDGGDVTDVADTSEVTGPERAETLEVEAMSPQPTVSAIETSAPPVSVPATPISSPEIAVIGPTTTSNSAPGGDELNTFSQARSSASPMRTPKRPRLSPPIQNPHQPIEAITPMSPHTISVPAATARQTSMPPIEFINTSISAPTFIRIKQQKQKPLAQQRVHQKPKQPTPGVAPRKENASLLMTAAIRSSIGTKSRNDMRSVTAFGVKVPYIIEEHKDFELPGWLLEPEEEESGSPSVAHYSGDEHDTSDDEPLAETLAHLYAAPYPDQTGLHNGLPLQSSSTTSFHFHGLHPPIETLDIPESSLRDVP